MRGAEVLRRARPGASPCGQTLAPALPPRGTEDHYGRLRASWPRWVTSISAARRIQHLVSGRWLKAQPFGACARHQVVLSGTPHTRQPFELMKAGKLCETSDPVRFHHQRRRKPCERDFQAE